MLSKLLPSLTQSGPWGGMGAQARLSDIFSGREWRSWQVLHRSAIWPRWVDPLWLLQLCHTMLRKRQIEHFNLGIYYKTYDKATSPLRTQSHTYSHHLPVIRAYLFQGSRVSSFSQLPRTGEVMARLPGLSPQPEGFLPNDGHRKTGGTHWTWLLWCSPLSWQAHCETACALFSATCPAAMQWTHTWMHCVGCVGHSSPHKWAEHLKVSLQTWY